MVTGREDIIKKGQMNKLQMRKLQRNKSKQVKVLYRLAVHLAGLQDRKIRERERERDTQPTVYANKYR
jgi:hypothetical protein